jgi:hypothetical protein
MMWREKWIAGLRWTGASIRSSKGEIEGGETMANNEPMIKLEPGGQAPILSYNVPEPTSYSGRNFIELEFPENYFKQKHRGKPTVPRTPMKGMDISTIKTAVATGMKSGFMDPKIFPNIMISTGALRFVESPNPGLIAEMKEAISPALAKLSPELVAVRLQAGERLNIYQTMFGTLNYNFLPEPTEVKPRLMLVETYRLSSFLGNYGAGRTIKTFSLLPGEKTKISVKTYTKRETDAKKASSILDSFTQESSDNFESSIQNEQSDKKNYSKNFEYHAEAEAKASWGWGSAKVSGGVKGGTNSAREEFSKNVSSASEKHAMEASAKRDVQINTSYEVKEESGIETSIEREIENINVSRTLNFVFRQMNQEFITLLHLVDVRVAFFNGYSESKIEVTLPELDTLLEEVIVSAPKRAEVRTAIVDQLTNIFDYQDKHHVFVEEKLMKDDQGNDIPNTDYLRVTKDYVSTYTDQASGTQKKVPGIILMANKYVLRTDGVIVEALLGQGDALDEYSHKLQTETNRAKTLANDMEAEKIKREKLGQKVVSDKDNAAADVFQKVFQSGENDQE